jgi:hypothetical protein
LGNLIVGFGSAASDETGGGGAGTANAGGSGDKLEQIERDVLIAPSAIAWGNGEGVHGNTSEVDAIKGREWRQVLVMSR